MKKIAVIILSVLMFASSVIGFAACSKDNDTPGDQSSIDSGSSYSEPSDPSGSSDSSSDSGSSSSGGSGTVDPIEPLAELPEKLTILYQGDSITDANRSRTVTDDLGNGYARMVSEDLGEIYGDDVDFTFINRANSGWKLIASWNGVSSYEEEFYKHNADIATILIGYNDIMAPTWDSNSQHVSDDEFEEAYDRLLKGLKERKTYAICIAPYYIFDYANDYARTEFASKRAIVKSLAEKYGFGYIDMKPFMEKALEDGTERMELFGDGTHPIYSGNKIIASLVKDAISKYIDKNYVSGNTVGKYERITAVSDNADDLTNERLYVYSSLGNVEYDTDVYLDGEMVSTQSVKLTNRGIESVGAYTKVCFVFDDETPNMTKGSLQFDVKVENAKKWFSIKAHGNIWTTETSVTTEYGVDLSNTAICRDLGNGWYHVAIDLEDWNARDDKNNAILSSVKQLVIMMSRGETETDRQNAGVDLAKESAMWIDNMFVSGNPVGVEISAPYIFTASSFTAENFKDSLKAFTFEYKPVDANEQSGNEIMFTIWKGDWSKRITELVTVDVVANTISGAVGKVESLDDGWFKVTINCKDFPINVKEGATGNETAGLLYFNTVNHAFLFNRAKFVDADLPEYTVTIVGGEGSGTYKETQKATAIATIPAGKIFVEWQINGESVSTKQSYTFSVTEDVTVTAVYNDEHNAHIVTVVGGEGGGRFNEGMSATVVANVPDGKIFVEWQIGGVKVSDKITYTFTVTSDVTITAVFKNDTHPDAKEYSTNNSWFNLNEELNNFSSSDKSLTFEYKAIEKSGNTGNGFQFTLWGTDWRSPRRTGIMTVDVINNTVSGVDANVIELEDGWYRVIIAASALPVNTAEHVDGTETIGSFILNVVDHAVKLDNVGFVDSALPEYTITVVGGEGSGVYKEGAKATIVASVPEDHYFVEWQVNGESVSTKRTYKFIVSEDVTITAIFNEGTDPSQEEFEFPSLTVAVFADVQLKAENGGNTRNAYLALKNHLKYAKSIGADVVFMPGDIVNNAVESYYQTYEKAIKAVYGTDESAYPEFILCMGNHEWWDDKEKDTATAVSLFNKYARIETDSLVKRSQVKYYRDSNVTLPSYYKVIEGIPFLVVSGNDSSGKIDSALKAEIEEWLEEISELPSVKAGGPIYVAYHYPIPDVTYNGEATSSVCKTIDEILSNYPSAIVFTGDTHMNAVNERTINQTGYTSINIGSSSYSRNMSKSAKGYQYNNVNLGSGKNLLNGEVSFKFEYTPTIQIITLDDDGKSVINRYFSADNVSDVKKIGITWTIDPENFIYTNDRIGSTAWANTLYGANGLSWASEETLRYNVEGGKMFVWFSDVIDYNCAEHYRIEVKDANNAQNVVYYDYSGHYFKYDAEAHTYHFILSDIPSATGYVVTVTAYDFFDNASLNTLVSTAEDETLLFPEDADITLERTYSDISKRVNYEITAKDSVSSVEYYYRGTSAYTYGMTLCSIVYKDNVSIKDYLSVTDWSKAVLTLKVKNPNPYDIYLGLTVITLGESGNQVWKTDFGAEYQKKVKANSGWTTIEWDLKAFALTADNIYRIGLKVKADQTAVDTENGYEMTFYLDNVDIIDKVIAEPSDPTVPLTELPERLTILYQGDSITDSNRSRTVTDDLGNGYARMVSEALAEVYGDDVEFNFINRANSGWKLIASWNGVSNYEDQFYQYDADIATILIGYNDIMASTWDSSHAYVSDEEYEEAYDRLLAGLKEHGTYAICIAPFFIFDSSNEYAQPEFTNKRAIVKRLAEKYGFGYIDMKPYMDQALSEGAEKMELFGDGTHPIYGGNVIISSLVEDAIRKYIDKDYVSAGDVGKYERITAESDNEDDLTNSRLYVYSTLGDVVYDTETYLNGEMTSSQSIKLTNRGIESVGTYTKVCFIFDDDSKPSMTKGTLEFDVKVENAVKWFSVKAHGSVWTNSTAATSEYGVNLTDTNVCTDLGNGWYHVRINLEDWNNKSENNPGVLNSVKQLIIMMTRGENEAARQAAGVDLSKESAMWIDNLFVTGDPVATEISESGKGLYFSGELGKFASSGKALVFDYKAEDKDTNTGNTISFTIWTKNGYTRITDLVFVNVIDNTLTMDTNGDLKSDSPVGIVEDLGDGWYRIFINCSDMPICTGATGNETAGMIFFNTVEHAFLLKGIKFVKEQVDMLTVTVVGGEGSGTYKKGASVTAKATVPSGKVFTEWQEDGAKVSDQRLYTFTVDKDITLTAVFEDENDAYTVTVEGGQGSGRYNSGTSATVIATVPVGMVFVEWRINGAKVSDDLTYTFTVTGDVTVTAIFENESHDNAIEITASRMLPDLATPVADFYNSGKALTFEYKATGSSDSGEVQFTLWGGEGVKWSPRVTNLVSLNVVTNTVTGAVGKVESLSGGWYRVTINLCDMPLNTQENADGTETVRKLNFNVVSHAFLLDNVGFIDVE